MNGYTEAALAGASDEELYRLRRWAHAREVTELALVIDHQRRLAEAERDHDACHREIIRRLRALG